MIEQSRRYACIKFKWVNFNIFFYQSTGSDRKSNMASFNVLIQIRRLVSHRKIGNQEIRKLRLNLFFGHRLYVPMER